MLDQSKRLGPLASGQVLGRLTVRRRLPKRKVECECACGVVCVVAESNLKSGATRSCGCFMREAAAARQRKYPYSPALRRVLQSYLFAAASRGLKWELSDEQAARLMLDACSYCGRVGSMTRRSRSHIIRHNGIDRVDNGLGYTVANSVSACDLCNRMKGSLTVDEFLTHVRRIVAGAR